MNQTIIAHAAIAAIFILAFINGECIEAMRTRRTQTPVDTLAPYAPIMALMAIAPAPGTTTRYRIERLIEQHGNVTY